MISVSQVKKYCSDYKQIENYEKAKNDPFIKWECHHRFELKCPLIKPLVKDLIASNLYYNRPAEELIFLTPSEHHNLHAVYNNRFRGKRHSEKTKLIMSLHGGNAFRGKHHTEEAKEKNRLAHLGKKMTPEKKQEWLKIMAGRRWFTDGINDKFSVNCLEGFRPGRAKMNRWANK